MYHSYPTEPWLGDPATVEEILSEILSNLDDPERLLTSDVLAPLLLALTPTLMDPSASRKSAELTAITLQRLGYPPSTTLTLIDALAGTITRDRPDLNPDMVTQQRQRLQARAMDTLDRRHRAELRSALALSHHDALTGLINRRGFIDALTASLLRAERSHTQVALALLDVYALTSTDKSIESDPRDHDRLLVQLAKRLGSVTRSTDTVARLGDTTFALLVEAAHDREEVLAIITRELGTIGSLRPVVEDEDPPAWYAGLAISWRENADPMLLLSIAEGALSQALVTGTEPGLHLVTMPTDHTQHEPSTTAGLRSTISVAGDNLEVRYQPIVDLGTGRITQYEALVRLRVASGLVGPEDFIDTLVREERRRLFEVVLTQVAEDIEKHGVETPVAINIEPDLISDENYARTIIAIWRQRGLLPHQLRIEITENQDLVSLAYAPLALLKSAGHHIALDDFGTGYASLSRIMSFPFDEIKLDRAFSEPIDLLNVGLPLMTVAIDLSHLMEVELVIEGIEDPRMLPVLHALGAQLGQGYALSRPLPITAVLALPNPLPIAAMQSYPAVVAAVQGFRWERAILALAASGHEGPLAEKACQVASNLGDPDLIALHQAQHELAQQVLGANDSAMVKEFCRLGIELRRRISTRLAVD
ncbi:GGDEF domain-containing phosphodiesterase [Ferrimicrobium sp.]|uniref:GGDEF domain-containing phosphodiesterase n=1 Tax=Ferrimicrobium sp. TaxID=2926050 RepID=UPI0026032D9B|nr:GGDEF domain-containing phosphodiesterase [Ferrimicrobium sp.]